MEFSDEGGNFIFKVKQSKKKNLWGPIDEGTTLFRNVGNFTNRHGVTSQQELNLH